MAVKQQKEAVIQNEPQPLNVDKFYGDGCKKSISDIAWFNISEV